MIKNLLGGDDDHPTGMAENPGAKTGLGSMSIFDSNSERGDENSDKEVFIVSAADPESFSETARKSGLAWSAGIVFFASITFMLILGWGADLLLGSSPWGIVGGIIVGSVIGFIQFFRLTSQIFRK